MGCENQGVSGTQMGGPDVSKAGLQPGRLDRRGWAWGGRARARLASRLDDSRCMDSLPPELQDSDENLTRVPVPAEEAGLIPFSKY